MPAVVPGPCRGSPLNSSKSSAVAQSGAMIPIVACHMPAAAHRFPHRNAVLGRDSTPEEAEYLKEPPSWGLTAEEFAEWEREKAERDAAAAGS